MTQPLAKMTSVCEREGMLILIVEDNCTNGLDLIGVDYIFISRSRTTFISLMTWRSHITPPFGRRRTQTCSTQLWDSI